MRFEEQDVTAAELPALIHKLRLRRREIKRATKSSVLKRQSLSQSERAEILAKTDGRCHICGGEIAGKWQADHVLSHSAGGAHSAANYLPAHDLCNNYRWDYTQDEFQLILRLGVWLKTQVLNETPVGKLAAERFIAHERALARRRKPRTAEPATA